MINSVLLYNFNVCLELENECRVLSLFIGNEGLTIKHSKFIIDLFDSICHGIYAICCSCSAETEIPIETQLILQQACIFLWIYVYC